ncbi:hypothetical protein HK105_207122 [Polyrhizophydium stewartii]|uniref:Mitochondrial carrier n=1 Tax=Polyrhizophydium stewartii TaxID=2732419 RepID=A0ABR4N1G5_9FUNG|nr:hypothetical protein HK105_006901 [Polyrhizophydium stewartii]
MIKIRLQNEASSHEGEGRAQPRRRALKTFASIWKSEGLRGLYRGVGVTAAGYLPTWAIYFSVYEWSKSTLLVQFNTDTETSLIHMLSAVHAGLLSTTIVNPIWVARTRIMTQPPKPDPAFPYHYRSTLDALVTISRTEGWRALYKGLGPSIIGVSHVAIQFPLYEKLKTLLQDKSGNVSSFWILFASAASKMSASLVTYPHEVVRTRLQTQLGIHYDSLHVGTSEAAASSSAIKYRGLVQSVKVIMTEEGWKGFYKGFGTSLFRTVPASALTLLTYEILSSWLDRVAGVR